MKELGDTMSEADQIRYNSRTLERLDAFSSLDDTQPYLWHRMDEIYNDQGIHVTTRKNEYTLPPAFLSRLKHVSVASEFTLARSQGNTEIALFILHPPKNSNPLRLKNGGV